MPTERLAVGGNYDLAFLFCESCVARWEINFVPIDQPPWSVLKRKAGERFRCPRCGKAVTWTIHGPTWRPGYSDSKSAA
jgi:hypothetical protein